MTSVRQPAPGRPYDALYGASASLTSRDLFPKPRHPLPTLTDSTPNPSSTCKHADPIYTVSGQRDHHRNVHGDPKVEKVQHFDNMYSEVKRNRLPRLSSTLTFLKKSCVTQKFTSCARARVCVVCVFACVCKCVSVHRLEIHALLCLTLA